jgi:hypothetical protein
MVLRILNMKRTKNNKKNWVAKEKAVEEKQVE